MSEISRYITIIRPEFMSFCKDACRAATLNHLLFRIAWKCKDQPKEKIQAGDVLWYAKTELITSEMSDAWGVCKVRKEVNALLAMNLLGKKSNPTWGADRTKHFFFGSEQCQVFIDLCKKNDVCVVHLDLPVEVKHLIYLSIANDTSIKCSCSEEEKQRANDKNIKCKSYNHQMETMDISDANDKSIEAITEESIQKITNKDNYEERERVNPQEAETPTHADAIASHTPALSQDEPYTPDWLAAEHAPVLPVITEMSPVLQRQQHQDTFEQATDVLKRITGEHPAVSQPVLDEETVKRPAVSVPTKERTPALSTSAASSPQQRAKLNIPARPRVQAPTFSSAPLFASTKQDNRAKFTDLGKQVCEWYDTIRASKVRRTNDNINACNGLAEEDGISFQSLKEAIEHWEADKFVIANQIPIDLQQLENPKGKFTYAKAVLAMKSGKSAPKKPATSLPSYHHLSDEEYIATLRGGTR